MTTHATGAREEWLAARLRLLKKEKELTRRSDELARQRQQLPWVRINKDYVFDTDQGEQSLRNLLAGRSQLLVYHFMFGPTWKAGCATCTLHAESFDRTIVHLKQVFNFDTTCGRFGNTEEHEGLSAFALEDGVVHHTYQCHLRGVEEFNVTYQLLDRAPRGRDEDKLPYPQAWVHRRDEYGAR